MKVYATFDIKIDNRYCGQMTEEIINDDGITAKNKISEYITTQLVNALPELNLDFAIDITLAELYYEDDNGNPANIGDIIDWEQRHTLIFD